MKHQSRNRILSLFLCALAAVSVLLLCVFAVTNEEFAVTYHGEIAEKVVFSQSEKAAVSVQGVPDGAQLQWQIRMTDGETWVDITGQTEDKLTLSYALVASIMDQTGSTAVRCVAALDGAEAVTNPVEVQMSFVVDSSLAQTPVYTRQSTATGGVMLLAETTYVEIRIEYVDEDGNEVFEPYIAYLESGTDFQATINSPTKLGYGAYREGTVPDPEDDGEYLEPDAVTVDLNYTNVTEDQTVKVVYHKVPVPYAVRYFLQNVNNDLYTESPGYYRVSKGLEGEYPDEDIEIDIPGFSPLYHQPATIAADGSTEFQVSYDRNYYLINFQLDGGYGVDPIYARYETHIVVPTPVKPGYVFSGWDLVSYEDADGTVQYEEDTAVNALPSTMPARNETYQAIWTTVDTTYHVAYWIWEGENKRTYLGGRIEDAKSGSIVSGSDDLGETDAQGNLITDICGLAEHTHVDDCYFCNDSTHAHTAECYVCQKMEHIHSADSCSLNCSHDHIIDCYSTYNDSPSDNDLAAINAIGEPESGYIYTINATGDVNTYYKFYFNGNWYGCSDISGESLGEGEYTSGDRTWTAKKYLAATAECKCHTDSCIDCDITVHTHSSNCFLCGLEAHTHTDTCYQSTRHMVFKKADENKTVEGDGSTVVNIYYEYKEYTLKFYYAATTGGTDTNSDGINDSDFDSIKIVGGSTYYFGYHNNPNNTPDDVTNLRSMYSTTSEWGKVDEMPSLNEKGKMRGYETGALIDEIGGVTYHYISFKARYGEDISDMWPCGVFESATRSDKTDANGWQGMEAVVSAWNGEHHVKYSRNSNETIKGVYEILDDELLFHSDYEDETEVSYLCFWENGANISWSVPELYRYNIYLEVYDGQDTTGLTTVTKNDGKTYYLADSYDTCDNSTVREQTQPALTGYTAKTYAMYTSFGGNFEYYELPDTEKYNESGEQLYNEVYEVNFYYTANENKLVFWNHHDYLTDGTGVQLQYGTPLQKYGDYVNAQYMKDYYPSVLEPDAYEFKGWYTTADFLDGTEMDWSGTMPDTNVTVYAKWGPVNRTVEFYHTYDDLESGTLWPEQEPITVKHGEILVTDSVKEPKREGYDFVGWFYIDETGTQRAFSLYEMEVRQDLKLYAEWHSGTHTEYIISYKGTDAEGNEVALAPVDRGYVLAGMTKTFTAKAGEELDPQYQTENGGMMWFPLTNSHSVLMHRYEVGEDGTDVIPEANKYTFWYQYMAVPDYTVRYLDAQTGLPLALEKTVKGEDHKAAVVTEQFLYIEGYLPDAANKRLVLSATPSENVITFYYAKQTPEEGQEESVYYLVTHYIQNLDGNGYSEYTSYAKIGTFGKTVTAEPLEISGFTFDANIQGTVQSAELTKPAEGAESYTMVHLKLYYVRNTFPYEVRYVRYDNHAEPVADTKTSSAHLPYGTLVTENAVEVEGFTVVGADTKTITIDARVQETDADGTKHYNIITFYYAEKKTDIYYFAVCTSPVATDFGHVSPVNEQQVTNDNIQGSKATAHSGFIFKGWYDDPTCTNPVPDAWLDDTGAKLKPEILLEKLDSSYSFYALFEPVSANLTIEKTGLDAGCTDNFIFHVQGVEGTVTEYVNLYITINGNGSVTIPDIYCGQYTITELGWSYEYTPDAAVKTIMTVENDANKVTVTNEYIGSDWLGDEDSVDNDFGTYTPPTT